MIDPLEIIQRACRAQEEREICEGCVFDEDHGCMVFNITPDKWDVEKINNAAAKYFETSDSKTQKGMS